MIATIRRTPCIRAARLRTPGVPAHPMYASLSLHVVFTYRARTNSARRIPRKNRGARTQISRTLKSLSPPECKNISDEDERCSQQNHPQPKWHAQKDEQYACRNQRISPYPACARPSYRAVSFLRALFNPTHALTSPLLSICAAARPDSARRARPHYPNGFRKCPAFSPLPLRNFPIKKKKPKVVPDLRLCRKGSHSSPLQQRS